VGLEPYQAGPSSGHDVLSWRCRPAGVARFAQKYPALLDSLLRSVLELVCKYHKTGVGGAEMPLCKGLASMKAAPTACKHPSNAPRPAVGLLAVTLTALLVTWWWQAARGAAVSRAARPPDPCCCCCPFCAQFWARWMWRSGRWMAAARCT
jgi:hypothetical protein